MMNKVHPRPCLTCQKPYLMRPKEDTYHPYERAYCSPSCFYQTLKKEDIIVIASCTNCGEDFTRQTREGRRVLLKSVAQGNNVFCGRTCNGEYKKNKPRSPVLDLVTKTCQQCNVSFTHHRCKITVYCSRKCSGVNRTIWKVRQCRVCGKEEQKPSGTIQSFYCSKECSKNKLNVKDMRGEMTV